MEVKNPKRLLFLGRAGNKVTEIAEVLASSDGLSAQQNGHTLTWNVRTPYYTATVPIWVDEYEDVAAWEAEFIQPEAKEVIDAVGVWVYCFTDDGTENALNHFERDLQAISNVIEKHTDGTNQAIMLANITSNTSKALTESRHDQLEGHTLLYGFELVDHNAKGVNEYGEKQGIDRLKEALETNDWTADVEGPDLLEEVEDEFDNFEKDAELFDLKQSLINNSATDEHLPDTQASAVDDLEVMLGKLLAVKEQSNDLPLAQRKRVAARAVQELMQRIDT